MHNKEDGECAYGKCSDGLRSKFSKYTRMPWLKQGSTWTFEELLKKSTQELKDDVHSGDNVSFMVGRNVPDIVHATETELVQEYTTRREH